MKYLFAFLIAGLAWTLPAKAQVGKEMKAFRDREGVTVTLLTPSLYSLYRKGNPGEVLKQFKEVNVLRVDRQRAAPALKEEIARRVNPVIENETRYALVSSRRVGGEEERLYVSQQEEKTTALVLWSENEREIVLVELKGDIHAEQARALPDILQVQGLERLAGLLSPDEERALAGFPFAPDRFPRGASRWPRAGIDSLVPDGFFDGFDGGFFDGFGGTNGFDNIDKMMEEMGKMFGQSRRDPSSPLSFSRGIEVTRENGKTRVKVNASNVEVLYLIDGKEFSADTLAAIPEDIATVDMIDMPNESRKAYVVINTSRAAGRFTSFADGVLRFRHENQDYVFHVDKLPAPVLLVNNRPTREFRVDPASILQVRPATDLERALFGFSSIQVIIVTR
ncbi:MAG: DUF4252 domain-containing protein [Odoribacteraceae bacterium]|jgi:hypothetical protein|nr:DUF4252 domain-containing protein [Odoribacteraceae bacterium]